MYSKKFTTGHWWNKRAGRALYSCPRFESKLVILKCTGTIIYRRIDFLCSWTWRPVTKLPGHVWWPVACFFAKAMILVILASLRPLMRSNSRIDLQRIPWMVKIPAWESVEGPEHRIISRESVERIENRLVYDTSRSFLISCGVTPSCCNPSTPLAGISRGSHSVNRSQLVFVKLVLGVKTFWKSGRAGRSQSYQSLT